MQQGDWPRAGRGDAGRGAGRRQRRGVGGARPHLQRLVPAGPARARPLPAHLEAHLGHAPLDAADGLQQLRLPQRRGGGAVRRRGLRLEQRQAAVGQHPAHERRRAAHGPGGDGDRSGSRREGRTAAGVAVPQHDQGTELDRPGPREARRPRVQRVVRPLPRLQGRRLQPQLCDAACKQSPNPS